MRGRDGRLEGATVMAEGTSGSEGRGRESDGACDERERDRDRGRERDSKLRLIGLIVFLRSRILILILSFRPSFPRRCQYFPR